MKNIFILFLFSITSLTFAQNSIRLVDLNSNYLSIDNSNGAFFETGDFTFEMWIKIDAWDTGGYAGYKAGILSYNQSNFWLAIQSQGKPQLRMGCGDLTFSYTASDWVGNWKHIALVRVGETLNWYVDGQLSASKSCSGGKFMDTNTINIGTNPGWTCSIDGWISKIRYVKGTAVYTSDFTPVFEDLENISGTELLLNVANETDAFKDSSNANHTINLHGSNANPYFVANNGPLMPADILMNGDVSIENNSIKNVADPVYAQDAATKSYVDSNVNSFSGSYNDLYDKPTSFSGDLSGNVTSNFLKLNPLTQAEINEISPEEGMVVYNVDQNRAQIYSINHELEIDNTSLAGVEFKSCDGAEMTFQTPFNCTVSGVSFYIKRGPMPGPTHIELVGEGSSADERLDSEYWMNIAENSSGWHTINYNTSVSLIANTDYTMRFWGPGFGGGENGMSFAVNDSGYLSGSITDAGYDGINCGDILGKDFLFILHVETSTPNNGTSQLNWINLN